MQSLPKRQAFFDPSQFDWLDGLRQQFADLRAEAQSVLDGYRYLRWMHPAAYQTHQAGARGQRATFYLSMYQFAIPANQSRCPVASAAVAKIPGLVTAAIYLLDAHSRILPHFGATSAVLRGHMGLICPPGCFLRVGEERRDWAESEFLIFDDTLEHEACNESSECRAILMFDFFHPSLGAEQCSQELAKLRQSNLSAVDLLRMQAAGASCHGEFTQESLDRARLGVADRGLYFA